jgi:hypothetical protein
VSQKDILLLFINLFIWLRRARRFAPRFFLFVQKETNQRKRAPEKTTSALSCACYTGFNTATERAEVRTPAKSGQAFPVCPRGELKQ